MRLISAKVSRGKEAYILVTIEHEGALFRFKFKKGVSEMSKKEISETIKTTDWLKIYESKVLNRMVNHVPDFGKAIMDTLQSLKPTLSNSSYLNYSYACNHFIKFLNQHPEVDLCNFTQADFANFLNSLAVSNNSKRHYTTTLKVIFNLMVEEKKLPINPFNKKRQPQKDENSVAPIPENDVKRIWEALQASNTNLYILSLLIYYTFIRPKEALHIQIKHIDLANRQIRISGSFSKTNRQRSVFIPRPLYEFLLTLELHKRNPNDFLLKFRDVKNIRELYHRIITNSGLPYYSIYRFKHSGVCEAYKIGLGIIEIKDQCGHTTIETTYRYLRGLGASGGSRFGVWA